MLSEQVIKVATFNIGLDQERTAGDLAKRLSGGFDIQAQKCANIIQLVRPDVLLLQEIDSNDGGATLEIFQNEYLQRPQGSTAPIFYSHSYLPDSNTGLKHQHSNSDDEPLLYGFGHYEGQYGCAVLSNHVLIKNRIRTFQQFLWKHKPNHLAPQSDGSLYYRENHWQHFRLSSKNHFVLPISIAGQVLNLLIAHPTPPVFDGAERRNARRNHDEIALLQDIIEGNNYLLDDTGIPHHEALHAPFIIMGDLNASTTEGNAYLNDGEKAITRLLNSPKVKPGLDQRRSNNAVPKNHLNDKTARPDSFSQYHTTDWGMRADYIIPSANRIEIVDSGIFWPVPGETGYELVHPPEDQPSSSDHRLVWLDFKFTSI